MHWVKKSVFGMFFMFFLFILVQTCSPSLFSPEFLGLGGLMLLLTMGFVETNFVTYE